MTGNPRLQQIARSAVYQLCLEYGVPVTVYKLTAAATNYATGVKSATTSAIEVRRCAVLPLKIARKFFQGVTYLVAARMFGEQGGQGWDEGARGFLFQYSALRGYQWAVEDWIVYRGKRYDVQAIEEISDGQAWLVIGKEVEGAVPEQIIRQSILQPITIEDEAEMVGDLSEQVFRETLDESLELVDDAAEEVDGP